LHSSNNLLGEARKRREEPLSLLHLSLSRRVYASTYHSAEEGMVPEFATVACSSPLACTATSCPLSAATIAYRPPGCALNTYVSQLDAVYRFAMSGAAPALSADTKVDSGSYSRVYPPEIVATANAAAPEAVADVARRISSLPTVT